MVYCVDLEGEEGEFYRSFWIISYCPIFNLARGVCISRKRGKRGTVRIEGKATQ